MHRSSMIRHGFAAVVVVGALTSALQAQSAFERLLVPVVVEVPSAGANGSLWSTSLLVRNKSSLPVHVDNVHVRCSGIGSCGPAYDLEGGATYEIIPGVVSSTTPASVLTIPVGQRSDLAFTLRVYDLSRQSETWGTTIPVVPESDFRNDGVLLVDVPVSESFRNTLRVYEIERRTLTHVRVRIFAIGPVRPVLTERASPDRLLGEATVTLQPGTDVTPSYAQLGNLGAIAPLDGVTRVSIQVQPLDPTVRIWAFVSVTNNETQHVTVITP